MIYCGRYYFSFLIIQCILLLSYIFQHSLNTVTGEGKEEGRWIAIWHINQRKEMEPHQQEEIKLNPANVESRAINLTWSLLRKKNLRRKHGWNSYLLLPICINPAKVPERKMFKYSG